MLRDHPSEHIKRVLEIQDKPLAVYLPDDTKISIERDGNRAWLKIEPTPTVTPQGEAK